jgi:CTP synthase
MHVTLVPYIKAAGELKTKPTQHSVMKLREIGIQPDILICRGDRFLSTDIKKKIALFCNVEVESVISAADVEWIYEVPLMFNRQGLDDRIVEKLNMWTKAPDLSIWEDLVGKLKKPASEVNIAIVGKYVNLVESYKSLNEALVHGGIPDGIKVRLDYVDAERIEAEGPDVLLGKANGILVPGGFGGRGIEGKIKAVRYAREHNIPYFGICLGMQLAVAEFMRTLCGYEGANSTEFDQNTDCPIIDLMADQRNIDQLGGTMRLGAYECDLKKDSLAFKAYKSNKIWERHRHRFEFNNAYRGEVEKKGMVISGINPQRDLVEIIELPDHKWFLGCQFHPEFKSRPTAPHPLFISFIRASAS